MRHSHRKAMIGMIPLSIHLQACIIISSVLCRHALLFGNQKINLHLSGKEFEPKAGKVQPGSGDLCFITEHPIDEVLATWKSTDIEVGCSIHSTA